ncbi:MAG: SLC13 family permease [Candidatus Omnitrophota bacterium]
MNNKGLFHKTLILVIVLISIAIVCMRAGFSTSQILATVAFVLSILGTLLFWEFRLSFAFLGGAIILVSGITTLEEFIRLASFEVIFFLIGMMILVGFLKEIGLFTYILQRAIVMKNLTARKLMLTLIFTSAFLACVVDEVSSIIFMSMIIFEFCDYFELDPIPLIIISVLATNIGSTGTVIGNPIGLLIAAKAGLTFEDFLIYSFPLMVLSLFVLCAVVFVMFRKLIAELQEKINKNGPNEFLVSLLAVPPDRKIRIGAVLFGATILLIAGHHRLEVLLNIETNTILLMAPLTTAAIVMVWRRHRARSYVEKDVEWWTLLFFIFLFAQAGVMSETGVAEKMAHGLLSLVSSGKLAILSTILFSTAIVSSALDNVVVVAGLIPVLTSLSSILNIKHLLWWAFLFGACFGGNITIIGSTANIMAIGTIEKQKGVTIGFGYWIKIGFVVGMITLVFVLAFLYFMPYYK